MENQKNLELLLKEVFNYIGLSDFNLEIAQSFTEYDTIFLHLVKKVENLHLLSLDPKKASDTILKPIIEAIQESKAVKDRVDKLELDLYEARNEVERLKPFETYYNLEYNMRNGNKE